MSRQTILLAVLLAALPAITFGQPATGLPPFGSFSGGPFDTVNNGNLNVHFEIPIINKAGRGLPFTYTLTYDSSVWYPYGAWTPVNNWGWSAAHCCGADGLRFIQRRPAGGPAPGTTTNTTGPRTRTGSITTPSAYRIPSQAWCGVRSRRASPTRRRTPLTGSSPAMARGTS